MTAVYYLLGVVIFVVAILASIGLHEFGHLVPAKKFGGKVTQWFIGFGPTLWSKKYGETEYGVKAIPLGGYVKIVGMLPPAAEQLDEDRENPVYDEDGNRVIRLRRSNTGMFTQLISDARAAEEEHIKPGDEDRLFYKMAWWKKVIVMAGGPTVNIAIAFAIFTPIFAFYGNPDIEEAVAELNERGIETEPIRHMGPNGWEAGPDPDRRKYGSYSGFTDPDGNGFVLQEVGRTVTRDERH